MVSLTPRPPDWVRAPDGMQAKDWPVWFAYQRAHAGEVLGWAFNVRLGRERVPALDATDPAARAFLDSLAYRLDAVALLPSGRVDLIEVATEPSPAAIGQLLIYETLWREQDERPIHRLVLAARSVDPDLERAARRVAIHAETYPT
jgi:hypothetical protein